MAPWGPGGWRERKSLRSGTSSTSNVLTLALGDSPLWTRVEAAPPGRGVCPGGTLLRLARSAPLLCLSLSSIWCAGPPQSWGRGGADEGWEMSPREARAAAGLGGLRSPSWVGCWRRGFHSAGEGGGRCWASLLERSPGEPGRWTPFWSLVDAGLVEGKASGPTLWRERSQVESGWGLLFCELLVWTLLSWNMGALKPQDLIRGQRPRGAVALVSEGGVQHLALAGSGGRAAGGAALRRGGSLEWRLSAGLGRGSRRPRKRDCDPSPLSTLAAGGRCRLWSACGEDTGPSAVEAL